MVVCWTAWTVCCCVRRWPSSTWARLRREAHRLLGSTGSIGQQTLEVVRWHPEEFEVVTLVAARASALFDAQVAEFGRVSTCLTTSDGTDQLVDFATDPDVDLLVVATSGTVGFRPTIAALQAGKSVALANKETLIMAGHLVTRPHRAWRAAAARSTASTAPSGSVCRARNRTPSVSGACC